MSDSKNSLAEPQSPTYEDEKPKNLKRLRNPSFDETEPENQKKIKREDKEEEQVEEEEEGRKKEEVRNDNEEEGGKVEEEEEEVEEEQEEGGEGEEGEKPEDNEDIYTSKQRGKKKKNDEMSSDIVYNEVARIIQMMEAAYNDDIKNLSLKKPAINKLKIFPEIEKTLKNDFIQNEFLNQKGLSQFEAWLTPFKDGAPACSFLKKRILENLNCFVIERGELEETNLGKCIMAISKNPNEDKEVIKLAKQLIEKWTRILMNNVIDYRRLLEENELDNLERLRQRKIAENKKSKNTEIDVLNSKKSQIRHVIQPKKNNLEFLVSVKKNPNSGSSKTSKEVSEGTKVMYKLMQDLRKNKSRR